MRRSRSRKSRRRSRRKTRRRAFKSIGEIKDTFNYRSELRDYNSKWRKINKLMQQLKKEEELIKKLKRAKIGGQKGRIFIKEWHEQHKDIPEKGAVVSFGKDKVKIIPRIGNKKFR